MNSRSLALHVTSLFVLLASPLAAQEKSASLDKALAKKISALGEHWWKARPPTRFVEWDATARAAIESEARAIGPIPEGSMHAIVELLWASAKKLGPRGKVEKDKLTIPTPYGDAWCYVTPGGKNPALIVGLHGGGEDAGSADEPRSTWVKKGALGMYPQGIRLVHDTWNTVHGERFVLTLIEIAKVQYDVDPDRVYVMGFSMGGSGSWFFAGRHPDLFAGAAPFSGVLMAAPKSQLMSKDDVQAVQHGLVPNVRNLALYYTIGLADDHTMPGTYLFVADMLAKLRASDPLGYAKIHFETIPDLGHAFPPGEPAGALKSLANEKRDTFPEAVVWEYARDLSPEPGPKDPVKRLEQHSLYWLGCKNPEDRQSIRAQHTHNEFTLETRGTASGTKGITLYLNAAMIDPAADVVVRTKERELYHGKPAPDVWTILETLDDKLDRSMVFDRRVELE